MQTRIHTYRLIQIHNNRIMKTHYEFRLAVLWRWGGGGAMALMALALVMLALLMLALLTLVPLALELLALALMPLALTTLALMAKH